MKNARGLNLEAMLIYIYVLLFVVFFIWFSYGVIPVG